MSAYINTKTLDYPLFEGDIRLIHPEIGVDFVLPINYAPVEQPETPQTSDADTFDVIGPIEQNGVWQVQFVVRPCTAEEMLYRARIKKQDEELLNTADLNAQGSEPNVIG